MNDAFQAIYILYPCKRGTKLSTFALIKVNRKGATQAETLCEGSHQGKERSNVG